MRPFDVQHLDYEEDVGWSDVQLLMDLIERSANERPEFTIFDPSDDSEIVHVGLAAMPDDSAWMLTRSEDRRNYFLALGESSVPRDSVYLGCPETVPEKCLLFRADAEDAIRTLIERKVFGPGWSWVPQKEAIGR